MEGSAVNAIAELAKLAEGKPIKTIELDGRTFTVEHLYEPPAPPAPPAPNALVFRTLKAFVEYLASPHDDEYLKPKPAFVHVVSPNQVLLVTGLYGSPHHADRAVVAAATWEELEGYAWGRWVDPETFNVILQTHFEETEDLKRVQELVGNVKSEAVQTVEDDGVSQRVQVRAGVVRASEQQAPRVVELKPYRTFLEVDQVASPFILRLRGGGDGRLPEVALFEADGGAWRLEAVKRVREKLLELINPEVLSIDVYA